MVNLNELVNPATGMVNRNIYVDREIYEQELEKIFARCWCYLGHESQVPNPGDFVASYIGEDPVLVVRDSRGKIGAFLNTCRHRGMRVCRADEGNAAAFTCTYHGWTYGNDGKLVGVPGYKEYYYEELDMEQWGLVPVAQVDSYKGMIFGTFDANATSLPEYLGDMTFYLDILIDRREGGSEIIGGVHKWIMPCNWKFAAENFGGDGYHFPITHISAFASGARRDQAIRRATGIGTESTQFVVSPGNGHNVMTGVHNGVPPEGPTELFDDYIVQIFPEMEERLGPLRARMSGGVGNIFPNMSFLRGGGSGAHTLRVWHPRGPDKIEVWSWAIVDKKAPPEIKEANRFYCTGSFSPGGIFEMDDAENWVAATQASSGYMGRQQVFNYSMAVGHQRTSEDHPGSLGPSPSEHNQRNLYARWLELMNS